MRLVMIATALMLAACQPEDAAPELDTAQPLPDQTCETQGGQMVRGAFGQLVCQRPAPDAGASCTSSADCAGHCLADGQICTPVIPYFGCYDTYENGQIATLCVD